MFGDPAQTTWRPSHRVVLKVTASGVVHCLCVMLNEAGDAWTRHDWMHRLAPTMRRTGGNHWAVNRHNLPLTGPVRVARVEAISQAAHAA